MRQDIHIQLLAKRKNLVRDGKPKINIPPRSSFLAGDDHLKYTQEIVPAVKSTTTMDTTPRRPESGSPLVGVGYSAIGTTFKIG